MKKNLKILSSVLSILLIVSLLSGCEKEEKKGLVTINLNEVVRSIFYAPMYAAIKEGFFESEGIKIELTTGQGADKTMQQVISGGADIGFAGPEQVIYAYNQGKKTVVFAQLTKRDGSFMVGRNKEENFKWESLKGKTIIGGRPGGVPEMTLEYVLRNHGLVIGKDVNIITNLAFTATAGAFKTGTGDYVALFEPTGSMLEKENAGHIVSYIGDVSGEMPYTCFFALESYISENPDIIQRFTNAMYKGNQWVESHSSKEIAESIIEYFPGSDVEMLAASVDRYKTHDAWSKDLVLGEAALTRLMDVIQSYQADLIPQRPPYKDIVTTKFAEEAGKQIKK